MKEKIITNYFYDIFDTIVSRHVENEYVKKIWATNIVKIFELNISATDLYAIRNEVECELGQQNQASGFDCEIKYDGIIKMIYKRIKIKVPLKKFYSICENEEVSIESKVLYVNDDIMNTIKEQKARKCKIYCVSDMYLTKNMIIKIFENLNILKYFDDIFVSSEYLLNKNTGKLYDYVLKTLRVKPENCLMTGDSKYKDYEVPISKGMQARFIDRTAIYKKHSNFLEKNSPEIVFEKFKQLELHKPREFDNIIYSLYNFIDKLYFKLKELEYNEVFFLAREGEFLKKLFDYYVENTMNDKIKSHYLYVSRKATYLPSLKPLDEEDFAYLLDQYSYVTPREFLNSLNIPKNDIELINDDIKDILNIDKKVGFFKDSVEYRVIRKSPVFRRIFEENRVKQNELFKKYILQHTKSKKLMIVDIGWNGSIQDFIQNILGDKYTIEGSYFGLCLRKRLYKGKKYGLVFSNYPRENRQFRLYYENRTIYEIMCGASHGGTNRYLLNKDGIVEPELVSKKEERRIYNKLVSPAQDRMFNTYEKLVDILCNRYYDTFEIDKEFNKIQFNMLYNPSKAQLQLFDKIYHYENFGVFEFTTFNKKNKMSIKSYIKENIKFFIRYGTYFNDVLWPVLKLYNNKMYFPYLFYKNRRYHRYKRNGLF